MELEILEDWLNNPELASDCHEEILAKEHSEESLRIFSQGAEQMIPTVLRHAAKDEGEFQSEEKLEEAGIQPAQGEMAEANLSEKVNEQQVSQENRIAELNFATGWKFEATEEKDNMGDLVDRTIFGEELQLRRLHKEGQPLE
jgi:hypothetical protein